MSSNKRIEGTTKVISDQCIFTWTIENYRLIKVKNGKAISSPKFSVGSDDKKYFKLELYPEGNCKESEGYISLFLRPLIDSNNKPDTLMCRNKLSAINGKTVVVKVTLYHDFASTPDWGWSKFLSHDYTDKLISSENSVTIECELEIFKKCKSSLNPEIVCSKNDTIDRINFDFSFLSEELSDIILIVEETKIPAHKIMLSAASPVFRAMFTHDMLENKENSVNINNTTVNILTEMLRYIYTGEIETIETDKILEILAVADKYQIDTLKTKCGEILCAELSTENAIDILVAAHKYKVKHLEEEVIKFVTTHIQLIYDSEKMKEIDDPNILLELMQSLVKSHKNVS
ncbi:hypothetical protein TKK_0018061 [Trichogramma kaykai]|uniref:BTB domain-containing protein n=1 Tax=Trichogramma kaykai TaxID=54128 RepID=A0ABD2W1G6_9HYME